MGSARVPVRRYTITSLAITLPKALLLAAIGFYIGRAYRQIGIFINNVEYVPFIGFQVFYTFVLGVICGQALLRFHSVLAPICMHFIFNLSFYIALQLEII